MQHGILIMGLAALALLFGTAGHIGILVVMYSVNVFITFCITQLSMIRFWITSRKDQPAWRSNLLVHLVGFTMCFMILVVMIVEKFTHGAWVTLIITLLCIALCVAIRRHYRLIALRIKHIESRLREAVKPLAKAESEAARKLPDFDPKKPTAVILVGGYNRLGRRSLLAVLRFFPATFYNIVFISIGVVNSEFFKSGEITELERGTEQMLKHYVTLAGRLGFPARYAFRCGTDVVHEASELCLELAKEYAHVIFFAGELLFERPGLLARLLHNETAYAIQRSLRLSGLPMVILPFVLRPEEEAAEDPDDKVPA